MSLKYRDNSGNETPVAGLNDTSGELVPSVSLMQSGTTTATSVGANSKVDGRVTFTNAMPDTNYQVILATNGTEGGITYSIWNKDINGFDFTIVNNNNLNLSISLQWTAFKLMTDEVHEADEAQIAQNTANFAPAFSETASYSVGSYVTYNNVLYRCTTAHTAGVWVAGHFTQVTVGETISDMFLVVNDAIDASGTLTANQDLRINMPTPPTGYKYFCCDVQGTGNNAIFPRAWSSETIYIHNTTNTDQSYDVMVNITYIKSN